MRFPAFSQPIARIVRTPALAAGVIVVAFAIFAGAPAHAACTVGGGGAIDGFAVGASVNCPTGTVIGGTAPPDGSTITSKVAGANTTFHYTLAGGGVGSVQLTGAVSLTAATGTPLSDAGAAAVANNNAQVEALFGGGNGGPTSTDVSVSTGAVFGPPNDPVIVNLGNQLRAAEREFEEAQDNLVRVNAFYSSITNNQKEVLAQDTAELEALKERHAALTSGGRPSSQTQREIDRLVNRIEHLDAAIAERESALAGFVASTAEDVVQSRREVEITRLRVERIRDQLQERTSQGGGTTNPFAALLRADRSSRRPDGAIGAFATSFRLSQLLTHARDTRLGQTETNEPLFRRPPTLPSALDMFANVSYSDVENDSNGAGYESKSWQGTVGIDYRLTDNWALGVFTSFTSNTSKTETINSSSDSFSYLVGPFVRFNATQNITLSASLSAGSTSTDLNVAGATSSFDSNQQLATFGIKGSWSEGNWTFAPAAGISYSVTRSDGFTDSSGNVNDSSTNRSGAINVGPTISYLHTLLDAGPIASITPSLGINGTYNYKHSGDVTFNNGVILTSDDLSASFTPGASLGFTNGSSASFNFTRSGIFSDVDGWSVTAGASAPVNLLIHGLGRDAVTNFQFTAEPQAGQTYMLRVVIPVF